MVFTLTSPGPYQQTITSSGLTSGTASWFVQNGNGSLDEGGIGWHIHGNNLTLTFLLDLPTELRLAGRLWTETSGALSRITLYAVQPDGTYDTIDTTVASGGLDTDILDQRLLQPGTYSLYTQSYDFKGMYCCNQAYGGSLGWDYTLELSALAPVPEPAAPALLLAGLGALATWRWRAAGRTVTPNPQGALT